MSCEYCEDNRDMRGASAGHGRDVEEISIECLSCFSGGRQDGCEFRINAELPEGYVMTVPINFCPMCGSVLAERMTYER